MWLHGRENTLKILQKKTKKTIVHFWKKPGNTVMHIGFKWVNVELGNNSKLALFYYSFTNLYDHKPLVIKVFVLCVKYYVISAILYGPALVKLAL